MLEKYESDYCAPFEWMRKMCRLVMHTWIGHTFQKGLNHPFQEHSYVELLADRRSLVFAHDINAIPGIERIIDTVEAVQTYPERALVLARPEDIVLLLSKPDPDFIKYLRSIGLGPKKGNGKCIRKEPFDGELSELLLNEPTAEVNLAGIDQRLSIYYPSEKTIALRDHLGLDFYVNVAATEFANNKVLFELLCADRSIIDDQPEEFSPIQGQYFFKDDQAAGHLLRLTRKVATQSGANMDGITAEIKRLAYQNGLDIGSACDLEQKIDAVLGLGLSKRIIIKGDKGASGSSIYKYSRDDMPNTATILEKLQKDESSSFIIQPFLESSPTPSSSWFITRYGKRFHLGNSDQLVDEKNRHIGNEFPTLHNYGAITGYSAYLVRKLQAIGYTGNIGIDYIVADNKLYPVEFNPRVTGATYPMEVIHRHGVIPAARYANIKVAQGLTFADVEQICNDLLYRNEDHLGKVIPILVGPLHDYGKMAILVTGGDLDHVEGVQQEFVRMLAI